MFGGINENDEEIKNRPHQLKWGGLSQRVGLKLSLQAPSFHPDYSCTIIAFQFSLELIHEQLGVFGKEFTIPAEVNFNT